MKAGWNLSVLQCQDHFDEAGDAGGFSGVADVAFDRPHGAEPPLRGTGAERLGERENLDRVPAARTGSVRLDVRNLLGLHSSHRQRLADGSNLTSQARSGVASPRFAGVVDRRPSYDRQDLVAVPHGVLEALEHDAGDAAGQNRAGRAGFERPAVAVG